MSLYRNSAASPFQNALNASGNAANVYTNAARLQALGFGRPQPMTRGQKLKKGLNGIVAGARYGQLLGEYGAGQGWWFNDYEKDNNGRWIPKNAPVIDVNGNPVQADGQGGAIPVNINIDHPGDPNTKPGQAPVFQQAYPGGPLVQINPETNKPMENIQPPANTGAGNQGGTVQQPVVNAGTGQQGFFTNMWNSPGGRGALLGAGFGLVSSALDYF